jgi:hypothetical protein
MDPPNVLWFFGAFAISFAVDVLLASIPDSAHGVWIFLVALGFLLAFALASAYLLEIGWSVPGGLAAALAVATSSGVAIGFFQLIGVWPDEPSVRPFDEFSGYAFGVALFTALLGIVAVRLTRFSFIFFVVILALVAGSQLLVPGFESRPSADDRTTTALIVGALLVVAALFMDAFGRRRDAFWFHVLGLLSVAAGLIFFTIDPSGDPDRGWVPMLIVATLILILAGPIRRASWAVYGVLGYYAAIAHYMARGLNEGRWPFALLLLALALSIFTLGVVVHRYGDVRSGRLGRRTPPPPPPLAP